MSSVVCHTDASPALAEMQEVNPVAIRYLNRLSDWFFAAARSANNEGRDDVLWVPGANREG